MKPGFSLPETYGSRLWQKADYAVGYWLWSVGVPEYAQWSVGVPEYAHGVWVSQNMPQRIVPLVGIWLKKLLEALDKFLTSLLDALGGSGAIGEYKSFMESSINDGPWFAYRDFV